MRSVRDIRRGARSGRRFTLGPRERPSADERLHGIQMLGPVVEGRWIEINAIRPDQRMNFWVDPDLIEERQVTQGPAQLPQQDWPEIDGLRGAVVEGDSQRVGGNDRK